MIILDTNVISALMRAEPDRAVVAWLDAQPAESIWTTSVTLFEVGFGISILPKGKRRTALESAFAAAMADELADRVLAFDADSARHASTMAARARTAGHPVEIRDVQIAGIAGARRAQLATRNTKHFDGFGLKVINPWKD
jgi:predicted nucleic acid-binding protein